MSDVLLRESDRDERFDQRHRGDRKHMGKWNGVHWDTMVLVSILSNNECPCCACRGHQSPSAARHEYSRLPGTTAAVLVQQHELLCMRCMSNDPTQRCKFSVCIIRSTCTQLHPSTNRQSVGRLYIPTVPRSPVRPHSCCEHPGRSPVLGG